MHLSTSMITSLTELARVESKDVHNREDFIGVLDVYVHQARDIQNICVYLKQDVYAKLCLTSDPENTVSMQIINDGGKNPVFNDSVRLIVRTTEHSSNGLNLTGRVNFRFEHAIPGLVW
ncbi:hypothetical protein RND81_07G074500 [Saponaria officinalis]|uniref:C2 domain-containing protein n=1 Tax=Saponaria officinalis TaxID=3572 RepID=A0AAW1JNJ4_SAPOF